MKRLVPIVIVTGLAMLGNAFIPMSSSDSPVPTPTPVRLYLPYMSYVRHAVPTLPPVNLTPPAEVPEYFDALQALPTTLGGDWVEFERLGDDHYDSEDDPYTWQHSVASVQFDDPNADRSGPAPYNVTYMVFVAGDVRGAEDWMDVRRADLALPNFVRCGRELTGLPEFGADRFGGVARYFHPITLECYDVSVYPIPYSFWFRIANVAVLTVNSSYNDDEALRVAYLMHYARIVEQCVRDKLRYN